MGQVFLAGKEAKKRPALECAVLANGALQHRVSGLKRIEHRSLRDWRRHFKRDLAPYVSEVAEMEGEGDSNCIHVFNRALRRIALVWFAISEAIS